MEKGKYPNGLAAALKAKAGMSQNKLADLIGESRQQVGRWYHGQIRLQMETAERMAPHLDISPEALVDRASAPVPLISWISAGALTRTRSVVDREDVIAWLSFGLDPKGDWIALRVEGDSMDRISPPESIILVNRKDKRLVPNGLYVIEDAEGGGATYKRYRPPSTWEPVSENKKDHKPLKVRPGNMPTIIGRVRRTILDM